MNKVIATIAGIACVMASSKAQAEMYCANSVTRILTYANGSVLVLTPWRGDFIQICNLNESWKGVHPSVCFAWMSKITNAVIESKSVGFWYHGPEGQPACSILPTYSSAPAPVYVDVF